MSSLVLIVERAKRQSYLNSNETDLVPESWSLLPFPTEGNQTSEEKSLIPKAVHNRYKMSLEHLIKPEGKDYSKNDESISQEHSSQIEGLPTGNLGNITIKTMEYDSKLLTKKAQEIQSP